MHRDDSQDMNAGRMSFDGTVHPASLVNGMTAEILSLFWRANSRLRNAFPGGKPRKQHLRGQELPTTALRDRWA